MHFVGVKYHDPWNNTRNLPEISIQSNKSNNQLHEKKMKFRQ